jgi:hypothetical protein
MMNKAFFNYMPKYGRKVNLNHYKLNHKVSLELNMGEVVPFLMYDAIPGDRVSFNPELFLKMSPLVAPVHNDIKIEIRLFYIPHRLVNAKFNDMYMGVSADSLTMPRFTPSTTAEYVTFYKRHGRLFTHFGLAQDDSLYAPGATAVYAPTSISLAHFRAYQQTMYHYYLDQRKFTEAELLTIKSIMVKNDQVNYINAAQFVSGEGKYLVDYWQNGASGAVPYLTRGFWEAMNVGDWQNQIFPTVNKIAVASGSTIPEIQQGKNLQQFYQNLLAAKRDFIRYSKKAFGISGDDSISEPLYLGGSSSYMSISDVNATTEAIDQPLGTYAGKGFSKSNSFTKFTVPEFGTIMGLVTVVPEVAYSSRVHQRLTQLDNVDFFRPELQTTFYDDIQLQHVYWDRTMAVPPSGIVGYAPPYNHYRYSSNHVLGKMATDLSYWNVINKYSSSIKGISIGQIHNYDDPETGNNRYNMWNVMTRDIFAVQDESQIFVEAFNNIDALRPVMHVQQDLTF